MNPRNEPAGGKPHPPGTNPGDDAPSGTPGTGENICPVCQGTGTYEEKKCGYCGGTGRVVEGIGGG